MPNISPSVFVFCALACEAKPLVDAWKLKRFPPADHPFSIYGNDERVIIVTGIGKTNMAGAVGYALALFKRPKLPILINLGIAGHRSLVLGTACLGHKITDIETGRRFYPQLPFATPCETHPVRTSARPHTNYAEDGLYEMEAAGFYELAVKFSSSELIQVVKIVSDNTHSPIADINENLINEWIGRRSPLITNIVSLLIELRQGAVQLLPSTAYYELTDRFHFSASRSLALKTLLQRWQLLQGEKEITGWQTADLKSAGEVVIWLENQLANIEFHL